MSIPIDSGVLKELLSFVQVIGSVMGCVIAPLTFLMFYKAFPVGVPGTAYPAPYATIYRAMAILGVEVGTSACGLPLVPCILVHRLAGALALGTIPGRFHLRS